MIRLIFLTLISSVIMLQANVNVVVSVLPQKTFVQAIGKDRINVSVMVKPGSSPHTYEPKPSQMKNIAKANIYFSIGVEFEKNWLVKFKNQNQNMLISNCSDGIEKQIIKGHDHLDPHIWTSPNNVKIIIKNILDQLINIDTQNKDFYTKNYNSFIRKIDNLNQKIINILSTLPKNTRFMVFHPAWGYFAKQYNLIQVAIEIDGKSPKPKDLIHIIKQAKQQNIKAIFTAPEFSQKTAHQIAKQLNIQVIPVSPLNPKWEENLLNLAKAIANK